MRITVYAHIALTDKRPIDLGRGHRDGVRDTLVYLPAVHRKAAAAAGCPYMALFPVVPK